jgi:protoporphyrinogen IX oxidase
MSNVYLWLKFLHVAGVAVWFGGLAAIITLNRRLATNTDVGIVGAVAKEAQFLGTRVLGPASGVTLLAGIVLLLVSDLGFPLWVLWGIIVFFLFGLLGSTAIRATSQELQRRIASGDATMAELQRLVRRMSMLGTINLLLLVTAVWAMVFKP